MLALGNVEGIAKVDDSMQVTSAAAESRFYTVQKGDTLSKVAKELLRRRQQVPADLRGQQADADAPGQDLPGSEAPHPGLSAPAPPGQSVASAMPFSVSWMVTLTRRTPVPVRTSGPTTRSR